MIKTLTKHGNSFALVIDKPILELLHAGPDTSFEISTDGRSLFLTPVRNKADAKKFNDSVAMLHKRFGKAMRGLAQPVEESEIEVEIAKVRKARRKRRDH